MGYAQRRRSLIRLILISLVLCRDLRSYARNLGRAEVRPLVIRGVAGATKVAHRQAGTWPVRLLSKSVCMHLRHETTLLVYLLMLYSYSNTGNHGPKYFNDLF